MSNNHKRQGTEGADEYASEPFEERASEGSQEGEPRHYHLPVGPQVISLPERFAAQYAETGHTHVASLIATRAWLRQAKDKFFLHIGDLEPEALED